MNYWTELSIQYANQRNYLDDLFTVYPCIPEGIREIDGDKWQISTLFHKWLERKVLGVDFLDTSEFLKTEDNALLSGSDQELANFARQNLGYQGEKGLDLVARFNGHYVVGEAKFLTDFGGHQNAQFEDAKNLLRDTTTQAVKVAILDGVLYIPGGGKMYKFLSENNDNIMSSLVLREFLYQL